MLFYCLLIFFQNQLFQKSLSVIPSECQTDWIQSVLSGLIWVQSVCIGYEQTKLVGKELMNHYFIICVGAKCSYLKNSGLLKETYSQHYNFINKKKASLMLICNL